MENTNFLLKDQMAAEAVELFDLFLKEAHKFIVDSFNVPNTIIPERKLYDVYAEMNYFNRLSNFNRYADEMQALSREELERILAYYKAGLTELGVSYQHITNRPGKKIEDYIREIQNITISHTLAYAWRYGDEYTRNRIIDYLDGKSRIEFNLDPSEAEGKTTRENGQIVYHISEQYKNAEKPVDLLKAAIIFGHETYRDGLNRGDKFNTRDAVYADIAMARSIVRDFGAAFLDNYPLIKYLLNVQDRLAPGYFNQFIDRIFVHFPDYDNIRTTGGNQSIEGSWFNSIAGRQGEFTYEQWSQVIHGALRFIGGVITVVLSLLVVIGSEGTLSWLVIGAFANGIKDLVDGILMIVMAISGVQYSGILAESIRWVCNELNIDDRTTRTLIYIAGLIESIVGMVFSTDKVSQLWNAIADFIALGEMTYSTVEYGVETYDDLSDQYVLERKRQEMQEMVDDNYSVNKLDFTNTTGRVFMPNVDNLNFRSAPEMGDNVIRVIYKGERLRVLEVLDEVSYGVISNRWVRVQTADRTRGWVYGLLLAEYRNPVAGRSLEEPFTRTLRYGNSGRDVALLHRLYNYWSGHSYTLSGSSYNQATVNGITEFQNSFFGSNGASGTADNDTINQLVRIYTRSGYFLKDFPRFMIWDHNDYDAHPNMYGEDIRKIQLMLQSLGYSVGSDGADGYYGKNTHDAVVRFQTHNSHLLEVDGIVGPMTSKLLIIRSYLRINLF